MFNRLSRPYKESCATETIEKIRSILEPLDLVPNEVLNANPYPQIFSVRLELDETRGNFGVNGKGRSYEYSLASGYGEFLERMQNRLYGSFSSTMIRKLKERYGFYYTPDEKYLTSEELMQLPDEVLSDMIRYNGEGKRGFIDSYFNRLNIHDVPGIIAVPFYDTKNDREISLPINLLFRAVGSNGMAAGNTQAEAVFQAICELSERWGAAEIYFNQLTPPTIPAEYLRQFEDEYMIIENIEKSGKYKVTIKDFSANKRIPAVGVIIENLQSHKYKLNVGCDTAFQVALSRCLTEVYQGIENEENFDKGLLEIPKETQDYFKREDEAAFYKRYLGYTNFTKDGSGVFPKSLFGKEFDYSFDPEVFTEKESYEKEVRGIISNFHRNGYDVYIRDVSFMGFPSVFVYIPKISAMGRKNVPGSNVDSTFHIIELDKIEPMVFDFKNLSDTELRQIADTLGRFGPASRVYSLFSVTMKQKSPWGYLNVSFILTQIWYKLGDINKARSYFKQFLGNRKEKNEYYEILDKYLDLKVQGMNEKQITESILRDGFDQELVKTVVKDMANPGEIFKYTKFPKCPDCTHCKISEDCLTKTQLFISHKLYPIMKENKFDQTRLSSIVNGKSEL
ncbi:MAG: YcaO-like family protein [bacterium]